MEYFSPKNYWGRVPVLRTVVSSKQRPRGDRQLEQMNLTTQSNSKTRRTKKKCVYNTWCSQAVTHLSTNHARPCLTSVFGREPVYSGWYGRRHKSAVLNFYIPLPSEKCLSCAQAVRIKHHLSHSSRTLRPPPIPAR